MLRKNFSLRFTKKQNFVKIDEILHFRENLTRHFLSNPSHSMTILTVYLERFRRHGYVGTSFGKTKFCKYRRISQKPNFVSIDKISRNFVSTLALFTWIGPGGVGWSLPPTSSSLTRVEGKGGAAQAKFHKYRRNFVFNPSLVYLDRFRRGWLEPAPHLLLPDEKVEGKGGAAQTKFCKYRQNFVFNPCSVPIGLILYRERAS